MIKERLAPGSLLIAPPNIADSRFAHSVIMLAKSSSYNVGLCLNKITEHTVNEILDGDIELDPDIPLYWGGPMNVNTVWMLHDTGWQIETTMNINEHWSMTSHMDMFKALAMDNYPARFRMMFGCSTWGPGQLEGELEGLHPWSKRHSWLTLTDPDPDWLDQLDPEDLWTASTAECSKQAVLSWLP